MLEGPLLQNTKKGFILCSGVKDLNQMVRNTKKEKRQSGDKSFSPSSVPPHRYWAPPYDRGNSPPLPLTECTCCSVIMSRERERKEWMEMWQSDSRGYKRWRQLPGSGYINRERERERERRTHSFSSSKSYSFGAGSERESESVIISWRADGETFFSLSPVSTHLFLTFQENPWMERLIVLK